MSYCRMGTDGSEMYLYEDVDGGYSGWAQGKSIHYETLELCIAGVEQLVSKGVKVPGYVLESLKSELGG